MVPKATLATSLEAAQAFAPIERVWQEHNPEYSGTLFRMLSAFIAAYPQDGLLPLAYTYLVFAEMDAGLWRDADATLKWLFTLPQGNTRDLAVIARARWCRYNLSPVEGFRLLRPLVGKIVDPEAIGLFFEEITRAATATGHPYETIAYMDAWLRGVSEGDRIAAKNLVVRMLTELSPDVIDGSLRVMRDDNEGGYSIEIRRLLADRLADVAIAEDDSDRAHWLNTTQAGRGLLAREKETTLAELALRRRRRERVRGRTIGLLLASGTSDLQRQSAAVMQGVSWALGLPRRIVDSNEGIQLIARDDGGDGAGVAQVLDQLISEGASLVIGGFNAETAEIALAWGERRSVPTLVLTAPTTRKFRSFGFVIGASLVDEVATVVHALGPLPTLHLVPMVGRAESEAVVKGVADPTNLVLSPAVSCEAPARNAGESRYPKKAWAETGVNAWLVMGGTQCANDLLQEIKTRDGRGVVGLTLDSSMRFDRPQPIRIVAAAAGIFPIPRVQQPFQEDQDPDVGAFSQTFRQPPDWWAALGHDAASLARQAMGSLPTDVVKSEVEVRKRREGIVQGLLKAQASLWTTEATGLEASHILPRTLRAVSVGR